MRQLMQDEALSWSTRGRFALEIARVRSSLLTETPFPLFPLSFSNISSFIPRFNYLVMLCYVMLFFCFCLLPLFAQSFHNVSANHWEYGDLVWMDCFWYGRDREWHIFMDLTVCTVTSKATIAWWMTNYTSRYETFMTGERKMQYLMFISKHQIQYKQQQQQQQQQQRRHVDL